MSADDLANRIVASFGIPYQAAETGQIDMAKYKHRYVTALKYLRHFQRSAHTLHKK